MIWLRIYLLGGLIAHKAVWEYLKRISGKGATAAPNAERSDPLMAAIKGVKILILVGIAFQTMLPDILPISKSPEKIRLAGAMIYTIGLAIALIGRLQLGINWSDIEEARVLSRQQVVSNGIYRFIRHPIYVGDILLLIGLELGLNSWLALGALALVPVVVWKAIGEEEMLAASLSGYEEYRARTKRFIPFVV